MNRKIENEELNRKTVEEFKASVKTPIVLLLDNVRSQHNIGSAFRTADAFLLEKILLCGITATPPSNEIHKAALGAENTVEWKFYEKTVDALTTMKDLGYTIIAVEQAERHILLNDFVPETNQKYVFIFGNEVKGVDQEIVNLCDAVIEIPQLGTKHSFNISVSIGIVLWDVVRKRGMVR